jgi:hypothetical protein
MLFTGVSHIRICMEELVLSMISLKIASGALVYFLACHRPLDRSHFISACLDKSSKSCVSYIYLPGDSEIFDDGAGRHHASFEEG